MTYTNHRINRDTIPEENPVWDLARQTRSSFRNVLLDSEDSVDIDVSDLLLASGADIGQESLPGNVFHEPTPPELSPWAIQEPPTVPATKGAREGRRTRHLHDTVDASAYYEIPIRTKGDFQEKNDGLPRFSFVTPEPSLVQERAKPSSLPRFSDVGLSNC